MAESFDPQGLSEWLWFADPDDIDTPSAPTVVELATGVSLGCAILTPTAPQKQANTTSATPLCATEERTIPALATVTPASLEMLRGDTADSDNSDLFGTLSGDVGESGWLVHVLHGTGTDRMPASGDLVDVWPSTLNTVTVLNTAPGAPESWRVDFTHNGAFHQNVEVVGGGS